MNDEEITNTHGKVDELNTILSNTQQKINKLKCACGSLTSYFKFRSLGSTSNSSSPAHKPSEGNSINDALETLDEMKTVENQTDVQFAKKTTIDIRNKVSSQLGKLDSLLSKTENAQISLQNQNKDMKKMLD